MSAAARADSVETVVVTGSRIPQTGLYSSSPVQTIGAAEVKLKGATSTEQLLRDLPAIYNDGDNSATNNASNGLATVDLHGLTPVRTLVLVDGKRLTPSDYLGNVDLNTIPSALIDHVEILTGGASSVYGGDAVAGVVNLVLKKDIEGIEFDTSVQQPGYSDGTISTFEMLMGASTADGKGNVTIYGGYQDRQPTFQGDRIRSNFALNSPYYADPCNPARTYAGFCEGGSGRVPQGRIAGGAGAGNMFTNSRTLVPYDGIPYNFAPINYMQTPNTHYDLGATGHYEAKPWLDFYTRLTFADNFAYSQLAETPASQNFTTNYENPLISAQEKTVLGLLAPGDTATFNLQRRMKENGPRVTADNHLAYQLVLGAKGDLGGGWAYDASIQYGRTTWDHHLSGDLNGQKFQQALLVTAAGTCVDPSNGCVPIDIFNGARNPDGTGGVSPAAAAFVGVDLLSIAVSQETDAQASLTGNLGDWGIQSPWSSAPVSIALGTEWRLEQADFRPDGCLQTVACSVGFGQVGPTGGSYRATEGFGEVQIPLVTDAPLFKQLEVDAGVRYTNYSNAGGVTSFKVGGSWQPDDDFRIRGSFNRAIREPNVAELFRGATYSAPAGVDPCGNAAVGYTTTAALCEATGVTPGQSFTAADEVNCGGNGQCSSYLVGNPALTPEQGDTKALGIVFTPTFLDGLTATVDYYDISVSNAIVALPFNTIVAQCYDPAINPGQDATIAACQKIHRDPNDGDLFTPTGFVDQAAGNIGNALTRGIDWQIDYGKDMSWLGMDDDSGSFAISEAGTYLLKTGFRAQTGTPFITCTGQYGLNCGAPAAKWRNTLRLTWFSADGDISISPRWRFIGATQYDQVVGGIIPVNKKGLTLDRWDAHIPEYNYLDISGTYAIRTGLELRAGVSNILAAKPPIIDGSFGASPNVDSGNTFPGTYDAMGRTFFLGVDLKL